jgi:hypothetical protein
MFMPKLCCRFPDVKILNVRVERLQDIGHIDAVSEGMPADIVDRENPRQWYFELWDRLNSKTLPANLNPWVFVYEFPKHQQSEVL